MKAVALVILFAGCSFIGVRGPGSPPYRAPVTCAERYYLPVLDGVVGGPLIALGTVGILSTRQDSIGSPADGYGRAISGAAVVFGVAYIASMIYGVPRIVRCRRAQRETEG